MAASLPNKSPMCSFTFPDISFISRNRSIDEKNQLAETEVAEVEAG